MGNKIPWSVPEVSTDELNEIKNSFEADWLTMGPKVKEFESLLANYLNVKHAVAVSNGTDAIDIALMAKGIKHGDEVIIPAMTYFSTGACVNRVGAIPVYIDICEKTWNLNSNLIEDAITEKTKGIIFIDYGGNPSDIDSILNIAKRNNLFVIQDAAQSLGGMYKNMPLGAQAEISTMSFHMAKILATVEGGMIFTHDDSIYEELKLYRKPESKKYLRSSHENFFKKGNIIQATSLFVRAIILYPFFWKLYKSSVFSYEFDVQKFIKYARERNQEINLFFEKLNENK
mgnify:CR=1 FL=1